MLGGLVQLLAIVSAQRWQADQATKSLATYLPQEDQLPSAQDDSSGGGERVDKLSSAVGDPFWRAQQRQLYQDAMDRLKQQRLDSVAGNIDELDGQYQQLVASSRQAGQTNQGPVSGVRNYHALVDEFKHLSPISNPSRESRAFKPKLMSTARGFGKRGYSGGQQHITYADLYAASNSNGPLAINGKMSRNAIR